MTDNRLVTLILTLIVIATAPATASATTGSLGGGSLTAEPRITLVDGPRDAGRWVKQSDCTGNPADDFWIPVEQSTCGDDPGVVTAVVDDEGNVSFISYQSPTAP